ncbi:MAG: hypothetical protein QXT50_01870 [Thermofilum sp.]
MLAVVTVRVEAALRLILEKHRGSEAVVRPKEVGALVVGDEEGTKRLSFDETATG